MTSSDCQGRLRRPYTNTFPRNRFIYIIFLNKYFFCYIYIFILDWIHSLMTSVGNKGHWHRQKLSWRITAHVNKSCSVVDNKNQRQRCDQRTERLITTRKITARLLPRAETWRHSTETVTTEWTTKGRCQRLLLRSRDVSKLILCMVLFILFNFIFIQQLLFIQRQQSDTR